MTMSVFWFAFGHQALVPEFAQVSHPHQQGPESEKHQKDRGIAADFTLDRRRLDWAGGQGREED
jgi:hypothetical protein